MGAGAGVAAAGVAACSSDDADDGNEGADGVGTSARAAQPADFDPSDWASVRDQFALDPDMLHFAAFVLASHPRPVAEAIAEYREALDRDTETALGEYAEREDEARAAAAEYLGAEADEVALTDSTTMGLGLLYGGLRLQPAEEVLATEHDFYSTHESLHWRSIRDGHGLPRVRLYEAASEVSVDEVVSRLVAAITPVTRAVAVTWVHSSTGVRLPIAAVAAAIADLNAGRGQAERVLLCVDGVHGVGAVDASVGDLGCDFLVSGTHKWLYGPRGTGLVWGRREAWDRVDAVIPPFSAEGFGAWNSGQDPSRAVPGTLFTPGGYHSFEHRWALGQAFEFHAAIGKTAVVERITEQATALKEGLAEIDGVEVITPMDPELSAGIVCVDVAGRQPFEILASLRDEGIVASATPYTPTYLRFGPGIVTTPDEVDQLVATLADLL